MSCIFVYPADVWDYFSLADENFDSETEIACNDLTGTDIYIVSDHGFLNVIVTISGDLEYEELIINKEDCEDVITRIFEEYLGDFWNEDASEDEEIESMIVNRELEIDAAVEDFLMTVLNKAPVDLDISPTVIEEIKEHFLEHIYRKHKLSPYRPMYIKYEDSEELEEHPYEHLVFDSNAVLYKDGF